MKKLLTFLVIATLILSGCTHDRPAAESEPAIILETNQPTVSTAVTEAAESVPEETESFSQPVIETAATTENTDVQSDRNSMEGKYENTEPVDKKTEPPETRPKKEEPKETTPPATTEPAEEAENTSPTEAPTQATSPPEEETTIPSQPVEETQPEPEFEISYWITFAKTYAQSIGLNLDAAAVDCWDNPITAGAHCIYLERDIKNRLNRYNADEDITDVWIWAVDLGNGTYDLYIGYA